jgi:hypothetical protein
MERAASEATLAHMFRRHAVPASPPRLLDPIDRFSEILFGLIMVLTFTGAISAAELGREAVRTMLFASIGCNLAWGIVDGVMYLFARVAERGRGILALRVIRNADDPAAAHSVIRDAVPPLIASVLRDPELEAMRQRLSELTEVPERARLTRDDFRGAVSVFLLVFFSTFPVVIPFIVMNDARRALRSSNGIAIMMLFVAGYWLGRYMGARPWVWGVSMVLVGSALVGLTIALGG